MYCIDPVDAQSNAFCGIDEVSIIYFWYTYSKSKSLCKVFKDNQSSIIVAESKKLSPRKKHIAIKYHNSQIFVQKKTILICYIDTRE